MNPLTQSKNTTILPVLIALTLVCFALSPKVQAVDPPPDGGYPHQNTAEGEDALFSLTKGVGNTAIGFNALYTNTKGNGNTAIGFNALYTNTRGSFNTANGAGALFSNRRGGENTAVGMDALYSNTDGSANTAIGNAALYMNTTGYGNTVTGQSALGANTTGHENTATGWDALFVNTTGARNTAFGDASLLNVTTGSNNIALGVDAGWLLKTGSNNIDIGAAGLGSDSNTIRIGEPDTHHATYIAGISGATVPTGVPVIIDINGHLGTITSSAGFKDDIEPMDKASEAILALKPVRFHYKKELDSKAIPQFGLVAEDVEKVDPDLIARDQEGKPYTVRYEAVNAMLLNEFLKEHRKVERLEATVAELSSKLEKVSAAVQSERSGPRLARD